MHKSVVAQAETVGQPIFRGARRKIRRFGHGEAVLIFVSRVNDLSGSRWSLRRRRSISPLPFLIKHNRNWKQNALFTVRRRLFAATRRRFLKSEKLARLRLDFLGKIAQAIGKKSAFSCTHSCRQMPPRPVRNLHPRRSNEAGLHVSVRCEWAFLEMQIQGEPKQTMSSRFQIPKLFSLKRTIRGAFDDNVFSHKQLRENSRRVKQYFLITFTVILSSISNDQD